MHESSGNANCDAGVLRRYKLVRTLPRTRRRHSDDAAATRYTRDLFNRWVASHPWSDPSPISIAARIWNEFYKRYCLFETFYDFVTGCIRLCEASGGNDTGTMLGEPRGTLDIPKPFMLPRRRIYRGSTAQSFSRQYRFCARTKSAEVVGPVNHRPGKLEGLPALHAPLDQIGSGGVHSLRR